MSLEIRPIRPWDWGEACQMRFPIVGVIEMVLFGALGADAFDKLAGVPRSPLEAPETLDCVPGRREGAGILDVDIYNHRLAAIDRVKALDDMELVRVRRAVIV